MFSFLVPNQTYTPVIVVTQSTALFKIFEKNVLNKRIAPLDRAIQHFIQGVHLSSTKPNFAFLNRTTNF